MPKLYLASFFMDSVYYIFDFICVCCGRVRVVRSVFASVHIWAQSLYGEQDVEMITKADPRAVAASQSYSVQHR